MVTMYIRLMLIISLMSPATVTVPSVDGPDCEGAIDNLTGVTFKEFAGLPYIEVHGNLAFQGYTKNGSYQGYIGGNCSPGGGAALRRSIQVKDEKKGESELRAVKSPEGKESQVNKTPP